MPRISIGSRGRAGIVTLAIAGFLAVGLSAAHAEPAADDSVSVTVMNTTDLHTHLFNWDYYADKVDTGRGLTRVSSLIEKVRAEKGRDHTLLLDNGDTLQGTPLGTYYARTDPITKGTVHPMAQAMNAIGYDVMTLGNHEFNYGIETLRAFEKQVSFPVLGANVHDWNTGEPAFTPYVIKTMSIEGHDPIRVGILGLTTPGSAIWDKSSVEGRLRFNGIVEEAKKYVPIIRDQGVDILVASVHSGTSTGSSYGNQIPFPENASTLLAQEVPGIDVIIAGHSHSEIPQQLVTNKATGKQVLLTQAGSWGKVLGQIDINLTKVNGQWSVASKSSKLLQSSTVADDPKIVALASAAHQKVIDHVNSVIGQSLETMPMREAHYKDVPALDFINYVQAEVVKKGLAGTPEANLPVLSLAAPFDAKAVIPKGNVTIRDMAGAYVYDNTLIGVKMNGAQMKDFLEWSAKFMKQVSTPGPYKPGTVTGNGPAYNYDVVRGLSYDIEISKPAGQRIVNLSYAGKPLDPAQEFVVATNNYRQNGGGDAPHIATAPIVFNPLTEVRDEIIDWVLERKTIDPAEFARTDWRLVYQGQPVLVLDTVPTLTADSTELGFGQQRTGERSDSKTVQFTNTSQSAITINSVEAPSGFVVSDDTCKGRQLASAATCSVSVAFEPTASTSFTGNLVVDSSASNSPTSVAVSGTGFGIEFGDSDGLSDALQRGKPHTATFTVWVSTEFAGAVANVTPQYGHVKGCDNVHLRAGQTNEVTCTVQVGVDAAGVPSDGRSQTTFTLVVTPKAGDSYSHTYRHTIS
ncbi:5'-nucleotidase C-terminal domain-containing protein [Streptosporangium sp. NPDC087985]|uniref:5'-nucleotidase C-terminal domain-containing protein n=1 Tax=Streptosporangium sp. NPDC087985 TaxID=3366196 RepID=UPI0038230845